MRPAQQRRRIARTWASAGVILLAMLLLAGSQQHAQRAHAELLVRQDQIATIRQATLLAQLHAERHAAGDSGSGLDLVRASLQRAQQTAADIGRGQGALRGLWRDTPPDPDTAASVERLLDSLRALDTLLADRDAASAPQVRLAMRGEQRRLEAALAQLEADALDAMDASRSGLARLTAALILMLAGIGVAFVLWQQRAARQTDIEAAAREAREAELDAFAGSVPDISFLLDAEGRFLRVHASRPELLMVPPEQALGRLIKDLFPTEQTAAFMGLIADTLAQGKGRAEYRLLIGGSERIFEARTTAVSGADRVVWVSWDVTERVRHSERIAQLGRLYGMLSACNQALVFSKDEASLFERVTAAAVRSGGYRLAWIASAPPSRRLVASGLDAGARLPEILLEDADSPLFELLAHEPPALRVHSRRVSPRPRLAWAEACASAGQFGLSLVCLGEHEGQRLVLVLHSDTPFDLEDEQQALLAEVAGDIEYALQLMRQRRQRERMQAHLEQQALALRSSRDGILLLDARGRILSANPAACEFLGSDEERLRDQPASLLADLERDPDYARAMREALRQDGHWQGEVLARHGSGQLHTLLLSLARVDGGEAEQASRVLLFTDITRQRETDARLSRIAHFDALTGLPNRDLLLIRLQAALDAHRQARQLGAAIMLDLDNFRAVNENAGWGHGDELLREVALRLGALMRPGDTLARLGGDEFVLVLERLTGVDEAERFVQAVQACLRPPIKLGQDERAYTQASLGLIRFEVFPLEISLGPGLT
jgi:diguanylate cyclase (GGDEF)-like protein/PAS domain S-box-containing protein